MQLRSNFFIAMHVAGIAAIFIFSITMFLTTQAWALSSANIPLDSPIYRYIEQLAGFGLISSDFKGIRPYTKFEVARLVREAETSLAVSAVPNSDVAVQLINRLKALLPREVAPGSKQPLFAADFVSSMRFRYLFLDGVPRNYRRDVHDPGNDGVFGIGHGLRPPNKYPSPVHQRGTEGTPLQENNNGITYESGHNGELRWGSEAYLGSWATVLAEPYVLLQNGNNAIGLNRGYFKVGGGAFEFEAGKDENWFGLGYRGAITLTNNAENFTLLKLSSPEPVTVSYLGTIKYAVIASRFDSTTVGGVERQPWFYAIKLSAKPIENLEVGFNIGKQVGGPGVNNSFGDTMRGLVGGTSHDNSNGLAGFEARYRLTGLRNAELYGEFSGEDTALFWPIVESYAAGLYIPRLTDDGRNDFRFEFFQGNQILYSHSTFPNGYIYKNMPIGHSQGGATRDFFFRYSHWFSVRNNLAVEYFFTDRGIVGRLDGQALERKQAGRIFWDLPLSTDLTGQLGYGIEKISNMNLVAGVERTNQLVKFELRYKY